MKLQIPPKVTRILDALYAHGYEGYAVGGCIRDTILARTPDDWDITTSARPEEVKAIFRRTVDTGLKHGTVTVLLGDDGYEVTTYRIDGEYQDHRHPTEVVYASMLSEDLRRRDFTINAMAYNGTEGLVDLFEGMKDLQRKLIRCVGNPEERFTEDALRILRAVRFSAQLGFAIEEKTREALIKLSPTLIHVSKERIQVELVKLLLSKNPHYMKLLEETGILSVILPELGEISRDMQEHLLEVPADKRLRLAVLLRPLGGKDAQKVLRRLKFDNDTIRSVGRLIDWYDREIEETPLGIRRALHEFGDDLMEELLLLRMHRQDIAGLQELYRDCLRQGYCYQLKQLQITGADCIRLGAKPGPKIGICLKACLEEVIEEPEKNNRVFLEAYVKNLVIQES